MELTVQNVYGLVLRSKLLSMDEAKGMFARWQKEGRDGAANPAAFAAWMVANRYLTKYQAGLVANGQVDGFFIGEYKILDRLGEGRMAGVFKAQHQLGQIVAIKVLTAAKASEPDMLGRFRREARLAIKLKHPNIVRAFQLGRASQSSGETIYYIVMEYLEGETLDDVMKRRGKLPPAEAVRLMHQALQGLQHVHGKGLVHRDIKPANMMLVAGPGSTRDNTRSLTLKLLDLGLGRALLGMTGGTGQQADGLTGEGVLLGTPDYMAPEQARDPHTCDIRADIYSVGCVLYQLLAGRLPFPDSNLISQMVRHATEAPPPLRDFNPAVPDGLQQIINWMMAKDINQRYPTPERAAQALEVFLAAGVPEVLAAPEADPKMRPYLSWLESHQDVDEEVPDAPVAQEVAATVAVRKPGMDKPPTPRATRPAREEKPGPDQGSTRTPSARHAKEAHRKHKVLRKKEMPPLPALPARENDQGANVELAPVESLDVELLPHRSLFDLHFDRRDYLVAGLGVLAGGLAVGIGCWLAVRGGNRPSSREKESNPNGDQ